MAKAPRTIRVVDLLSMVGLLVAIVVLVAHLFDYQRLTHVSQWAAIVTMILTFIGWFAPSENWHLKRRRDKATAVLVPRQLLNGDNHFTGREGEKGQFNALLGDRDRVTKIVVVSGTAGVGKTALVINWAHQVRRRFPDGDLYVDLGGYASEDRANVGQILDRFLRALGGPDEPLPSDLSEKVDRYRTLMHDRRILVVLDNAIDADQVGPLLPGSPDALVVVTSRNPLSDLLIGLGARRVSLEPLPEGDAIELLGRVLGARVSDDPVAAAELARVCGYLPLALRIVAERAALRPDASVSELAEGFAQAEDRLDLLSVPGDGTITLRRVFSWSYRALPQGAAVMFRLLGLHAGADISVHAAAALAGILPYWARQQLELLAKEHLVEALPGDRHRLLHDPLRGYAAERAEAEDSEEFRSAAMGRLFDWYLHTADAANRALEPHRHRIQMEIPSSCHPLSFATPDEALRWCDSERANLVAAVRQAADAGQHAVAWRLPAALLDFFVLRVPWADWDSTHGAGLSSARVLGDRLGEAQIMLGLGARYQQQGLFDKAIGYFEGARDICREIGDRRGEATSLVNLGHGYLRHGLNDEAEPWVRSGLKLSQEVGDRWLETWALIVHGMTLLDLQRPEEEVLEKFRRARADARELGNRRFEGMALQHLGAAHLRAQRHSDARGCVEKALEIFQGISYRLGEAETLQLLGDIKFEAGRSGEARGHWRCALDIFVQADVRGPIVKRLRASLGLR